MTYKGEQVTHKGEFQGRLFRESRDISAFYLRASSAHLLREMQESLLQKAPNPVYQMIFVIKGKLSFSTPGSSAPLFTMESQQHNLIRTDQEVLTLNASFIEANEIIFIHISADFLSRYFPYDHPAFSNLSSGNLHDSTTALFSEQQLHLTPEINAILNSMENSTHTGFCGKLFLESKVIELLAIQLSQFALLQEQPKPLLKPDELDRMEEIRSILINNMDRQLSLKTLAHMVGTNEFNLKKQFKAAYGTTVYGYLNQYKMEQAKAMLIQGDSRISEVSGKMGYKHATHFTSAFKKYFGYLPNKIKMLMLVFDPEFCLVLFPIS